VTDHTALPASSRGRWTTVRTVVIPLAAVLIAVGALIYAITKPSPSSSQVASLRSQVASLTSQVNRLRSGAINADAATMTKILILQHTVGCLRKWQNKLQGEQPAWLVPSNGYPANAFLMTLTGTLIQC
jgi:outer membrane murein-binding lipoprotein Lpp